MLLPRAFAFSFALAVPAAVMAADIPGGPGTQVRVSLGATVASDLGSATDADWFRASLQAGKLYAFTYRTGSFVGRDGVRFRFTARDTGGRVLAVADRQAGGEFDLTAQLNFRPKTAGTYFFEVKLAPGQPPGFELPVLYEVGLARDVSSGFDDAARLPFNRQVAGKLQTADDADYFVVQLEKGKPIDLLAPVGNFDFVFLYDRSRRRVGEVDLDFDKLAYYVPSYTGDHFISVESISEILDYTLKVAPADRGRPTPGADLLIGTNGPDSIDALDGADQVRGLAGDDVLSGGPGEDAVSGGPGDDRVKGGDGQDYLFGEDGDDVLTGGLGLDFMTGGPGADQFRFFGDAARGYDSGTRTDPTDQGFDRIEDFAAGDRVDLRGVDADATRAGRQPFAFVGTAPFSRPGQVRYRFEPDNSLGGRTVTVVALNTDADPAPEMAILLAGRHALRAVDFLLRDRPAAPAGGSGGFAAVGR